MELIKANLKDDAARTLAEAFRDDPLMQIIAPNERKRPSVSEWFFSKAIGYGMRWGEVSCNDDASAVAVWLTPGNTEMSPGRMLRAGLGALPVKAGINGAMRFMKALSAVEKFHKAVDGPHWYLLAIGTTPSRQGQGLGSSLMEMGISKADAAGIPCYLETATDADVAFYSNRGFEVTGQAEVLGFTLSGMVRRPR